MVDITASSSSGANSQNKTLLVLHGRNEEARKALFEFLRALDLNPLEWSQAIALTGEGTPAIQTILSAAFEQAQALVVLLTGDDLVSLREESVEVGEESRVAQPIPQARANVLFEAGLAMGAYPERTIIVELGDIKPFSDISGLHTIRMDDSKEKRNDLAGRLESAGCAVDRSGDDWLTAGQFEHAVLPAPTLAAENAMQDAHGSDEDLTDDEVIILSRIAKARDPLSDFDTAGIMGWTREKARHHLEDLYKREYIKPNHMVTARHKYELLQKGRESLVDRGLL